MLLVQNTLKFIAGFVIGFPFGIAVTVAVGLTAVWVLDQFGVI